MVISLACSILEDDPYPLSHEWVCETIGKMVIDFKKFMEVFLDKFEG